MSSSTIFELVIGSVLIVIAVILFAFPAMTYKLIDATAGRTAEKWAQAGADASWRMYHWQRPLLRFLSPIVLLITGVAFLVKGLT